MLPEEPVDPRGEVDTGRAFDVDQAILDLYGEVDCGLREDAASEERCVTWDEPREETFDSCELLRRVSR